LPPNYYTIHLSSGCLSRGYNEEDDLDEGSDYSDSDSDSDEDVDDPEVGGLEDLEDE
jgi:hypothetical protein